MVAGARQLQDTLFSKEKDIEDLKLDLSPNSLIVDLFGKEIVNNPFKLELIKRALIDLYILDLQIDEDPDIKWDEDFQKKFKEAERFLLILLHDRGIGGISYYFEIEIIFDPRKRIYRLVKPIFYFE
jgi:hypothetical protein